MHHDRSQGVASALAIYATGSTLLFPSASLTPLLFSSFPATPAWAKLDREGRADPVHGQ